MAKIKTFTNQLKIFHVKKQLEELDEEVNRFIESRGITRLISVSDTVTTGSDGEAIGIIRVISYDP